MCFQVETKGYVQHNLFGSTVVENTVIESNCSVTAVFKWSNVEKIFQMPPQSSEAVLVSRTELKSMGQFSGHGLGLVSN